MDERLWTCYLALLACHEQNSPCTCVGCWYEQHSAGEVFPGDRVSSTLCREHRLILPPAI
jgi:hypothetical protein